MLAYISLVQQFESEGQQFISGELRPYVTAHSDRYGGLVATGHGVPGVPHSRFTQNCAFLSDRAFSNLLVQRRGQALLVRTFRRGVGVHADSAFVALQADLQ